MDYGAGKRTLESALSWMPVKSYDPAIPEIAGEPDPADLVVCTDVIEHIEPDCLDDVLDHIRRLTLKALYLEVTTVEAHKHLEDGRNAHLIVQPIEWWLPKLWQRFQIRSLEVGRDEKGFLMVLDRLKG